jgi:hypothetical protein
LIVHECPLLLTRTKLYSCNAREINVKLLKKKKKEEEEEEEKEEEGEEEEEDKNTRI